MAATEENLLSILCDSNSAPFEFISDSSYVSGQKRFTSTSAG